MSLFPNFKPCPRHGGIEELPICEQCSLESVDMQGLRKTLIAARREEVLQLRKENEKLQDSFRRKNSLLFRLRRLAVSVSKHLGPRLSSFLDLPDLLRLIENELRGTIHEQDSRSDS